MSGEVVAYILQAAPVLLLVLGGLMSIKVEIAKLGAQVGALALDVARLDAEVLRLRNALGQR